MKHLRLVRRLLVVSACLYSMNTWAQSEPDEATLAVGTLLVEGDRLFEAADYAGALERYQKADARMPVPTTGLRVAKAQAHLGKFIDARNSAVAVSQLPVGEKEPPVVVEARQEAAALAEELSARIPSLVVRIQGEGTAEAVSGVVLTLDGEPLEVGATREVDPGNHRIVASAPGYSEIVEDHVIPEPKTTQSTPEGTTPPAGATSEGAFPLKVVEILLTLKPTAAQPPPSLPPPAPLPQPQPEAEPSLWSRIPVLGYVGFGVGALGLGVGSVTGILSLSKAQSIRDDDCNGGDACDPKSQDRRDSANLLANVSNVAFGVGLVGVGLGVYAVVSHPNEAASASPRVAELSLDLGRTPVVLRPEVNAQGMFVTGEF